MSTRAGAWRATACALVLTAATGCSSADQQPAADPPPATAPAPAVDGSALGPEALPHDEDLVEEDHDHLPELPASPTWDQGSRDAAVSTATAAMTAFARPDLSAQTWWAQLSPLLSGEAATAYQGVDPANIPAEEVTEPARLEQETSAYLATVTVPTDVGDYTVLLARSGQGQPWLVERLVPPEDAAP